MIEKCNSTHARNHRKLRQAHIKKMVPNEDAFAQRFRTAKGIRTRFFFFGSGAIAAHGPKPEKASPDPFCCSKALCKRILRKVYTEKISGPYQLF